MDQTISSASQLKGLTANLAGSVAQLRAVAGLSINIDDPSHALPLAEVTNFVDRCRYYAHMINAVPAEQQNPEMHELLIHYTVQTPASFYVVM